MQRERQSLGGAGPVRASHLSHPGASFPLLVEAVSCLCKGERPDLSWIPHHASLLVPSTP